LKAAQKLLAIKPYSTALMTVSPDTLSWYAAGVEELFDLGFLYVIPSLDYSANWQEEDLPELARQYEKLADIYERKTALFVQKHYNDFFPLLSLMEDQLWG